VRQGRIRFIINSINHLLLGVNGKARGKANQMEGVEKEA
jgi:hypothetical protein